jgi:pantoate--beta-alanine ligase
MEELTTAAEVREMLTKVRLAGKKIGLVPTMGALHTGHAALIQKARDECDAVVLSIFVNPTQFGPGEDFERYPRPIEKDREIAQSTGVDFMFTPAVEEVYPQGDQTFVEVAGISNLFEGAARPGHFRGVATVCTKLFSIVQPDKAVFGRKDYQQLVIVRRLVADLRLPIEIIGVPTVREPDGLAMSSRNEYLSESERSSATVLYAALKSAAARFEAGERAATELHAVMVNEAAKGPLTNLEYAEVVDTNSLLPVKEVASPAVALIAARVGSTRLIDNVILDPARPELSSLG